MIKNYDYLQNELSKLKLTDTVIKTIIEIIKDNSLIGHANKDKIIAEFKKKLNVDEDTCNLYYNLCAKSLIYDFFKS